MTNRIRAVLNIEFQGADPADACRSAVEKVIKDIFETHRLSEELVDSEVSHWNLQVQVISLYTKEEDRVLQMCLYHWPTDKTFEEILVQMDLDDHRKLSPRLIYESLGLGHIAEIMRNNLKLMLS